MRVYIQTKDDIKTGQVLLMLGYGKMDHVRIGRVHKDHVEVYRKQEPMRLVPKETLLRQTIITQSK